MVTRRPPRTPRTLPGTDALLLQKIFLFIFLGMVVVILALTMATAAADGAQAPGGQLPWPIIQWAVTTSLGTLAVALAAARRRRNTGWGVNGASGSSVCSRSPLPDCWCLAPSPLMARSAG